MADSCRVLIVDDHPINVEILKELLEDEYTLAMASSGEEAMAIAPDFVPDLVLLDVMLPGIDGYETCRRLRGIPTLGHTKIILLSARTMPEERARGYEAGADDFLSKPFMFEQLMATVHAALGGTEARSPGDRPAPAGRQ